MSTIHSSWALLGCKSSLSLGTARFSTVRSMAYTRHGRASTANPTHSRRPALGVVEASVNGSSPRGPGGDHPPEPVEDAGPATAELVPEPGGREAALDDRQPRPAALLLEGDLHARIDVGSVRHRHRRRVDQPPRPVDHLEHVGLARRRAARRPERDGPAAPDPK